MSFLSLDRFDPLSIGGVTVKTVRSHLTVNDLARQIADGATKGSPLSMPAIEEGAAIQGEAGSVARLVSSNGTMASLHARFRAA